ncbi:MoxR family ATPase [Sulfurovum sp. bin170]|uniref:AAA family ATPase n=1 Tax=Sulfurovum sp. bin170 TaxID=2695268 RepID=UPI0013E0AC23|nr:MoxR family ATPase [Sulfurovum sp. bin170]NEW60026.1 MoxR family ATPase [Sulfurovum sp. bin170]
MNTSWYIFTGDKKKKGIDIDTLNKIAPAPSWRKSKQKGDTQLVYLPSEEEKAIVNASIYLRRPLLLTGKAGTGKSSLAYAIADELGLELYHWAINSKSTLEDGLYSYDAISRLQDAQLKKIKDDTTEDEITKYLKLAPLGKAFASNKKSVLLIDELDKSDIDLPNDLLHILEENKFEIDVLKRYSSKELVNLGTEENPIMIKNGEKEINIDNFPIIIMTSNGERDFPPAFMRRCLHHEMELPTEERLIEIVTQHLNLTEDDENLGIIGEIVKEFIEKRDGLGESRQKSELATDQLLNALYLRLNVKKSEIFNDILWHSLD